MSTYKRGGVWWYEFSFQGQRIRESAKTSNKTIAREAERARRHELERAVNGIVKRERPPLLSVAVERWLDSRAGLAPHTLENYRLYSRKLAEYFGQRLVSDIDERDIAGLIRERQRKGLKPRRINIELAVLRMMLRHFGVWDSVKGRVRPLREPHDVGRAISHEDEENILTAIRDSRSPALLPLFVLSLDTGLRASELRALRHRDLNLTWRNGAIEQGWFTVSRSKTEGGTGRTIPLTRRGCAVLSLWLSRFPGAAAGPLRVPGAQNRLHRQQPPLRPLRDRSEPPCRFLEEGVARCSQGRQASLPLARLPAHVRLAARGEPRDIGADDYDPRRARLEVHARSLFAHQERGKAGRNRDARNTRF